MTSSDESREPFFLPACLNRSRPYAAHNSASLRGDAGQRPTASIRDCSYRSLGTGGATLTRR